MIAIRRHAVLLTVFLGACAAPGQAPAQQVFESQHHGFRAVTLVEGLSHPWALAFLPDGRMLVTERAGRLRVVADGVLDPDPVAGTPEVFARGQGGLLDLVLHPDYADNGWLYMTYAAPREGGASTAVARARLDGKRLVDLEEIFVAENVAGGTGHFGSRIAFAPDGTMYVTVGERRESARSQSLADHFGTVVRLNPDGSVPPDNPFVGRDGARPEIFSYGHRNAQGLTVHPERGDVWEIDHGPRGGDEINLLEAGANYGWPVITHGMSYAGLPIGEGTSKPGMEQPLLHWTPSIAPSGAAFYAGDAFPRWRGDLFVGSLVQRHLHRVRFDGTAPVEQERLLEGTFGRIRDVRQGPDGLIYVINDEPAARIVRLEPAGD